MAEDKRQQYLVSSNMTNFFNRELFLYSLGDIEFQKPVSLKKAAYVLALMVIWTIPLILIFGLMINPWFIAIAFVPPFVVGNFADKKIFGGKTLFGFAKTMTKHKLREPKGWTDLDENNEMGEDVYTVSKEIWISRRREIKILRKMKEREAEEIKAQRKLLTSNKKIVEPESKNSRKTSKTVKNAKKVN